MIQKTLNIFYEEPKNDRWFPYDRYPREIIRRIIRGKARPGGVMMVALELMRGLDKIGVSYRFNDYRYIKSHPNELACVIGKPHLIFEKRIPNNPILFGAGVYSHPIDCPDLFEKYPNVKKFLVPGEWMRQMCEPFYGDKVVAWPVGIDTEKWKPSNKEKINVSKRIKELGERCLQLNPSHAGAYHLLGKWHYEVFNLNFVEKAAINMLFGGMPTANIAAAITNLQKAILLKPTYLLYQLDYFT